ncbi:MAG: DUF3794 domain-containing protein [Oscillospiraceae bacterium]|nr:DUF3794 domain-containing protein [Oscillospiraceae bacterium]
MEKEEKQGIFAEQIIYDAVLEQGAEIDCIVPDYCPEVFRTLSCTLSPRIMSYAVSSDGKLSIDGEIAAFALYSNEDGGQLCTVTGRTAFSKTITLGAYSDDVRFSLSEDYCTSRAVSPRRIDVRGSVSIGIKAFGCTQISRPDIPENLELKTEEIACAGKTIFSSKKLVLREEIDTGASGISFVIDSSAVPKITDLRIVADKAVLKGTICVDALYGVAMPESSASTTAEKMTADVPVSAILDVAGISDEYTAIPSISILGFELIPRADSGVMSCEITAECTVKAAAETKVNIASDAYSTSYETEINTGKIKLGSVPKPISQSFQLKLSAKPDEDIAAVWDCRAEIKNAAARNIGSDYVLSGLLRCRAYGKSAGGSIFFIEKQEPFEQKLLSGIGENSAVCFSANVSSASFAIMPDNSIEITAMCDVSGDMREAITLDALSSVKLLEDKPKQKDGEFAIRICYADEPKDCWDIAKEYNTTVSALLEENTVNDENKLEGMIVVPSI